MSNVFDRMQGTFVSRGSERPDPCTVNLDDYPPSTRELIRKACEEQKRREAEEQAEPEGDG